MMMMCLEGRREFVEMPRREQYNNTNDKWSSTEDGDEIKTQKRYLPDVLGERARESGRAVTHE